MDQLISIDEAAEFLKVEKTWIYSQTRQGKIPHFKVGKYVRFRKEELQAWLGRHQRGND